METVLRVIAIYLFLMVSLRVLGKREFGQLSPLEMISILLIPEIISNALQLEITSMTEAVIGVTTLLSLTVLTSIVVHRSQHLERAIVGQPVVLAHKGQLVERNMNLERITSDEIMGEVRRAGLESMSQVGWAILETDGSITVIRREDSTDADEDTARIRP